LLFPYTKLGRIVSRAAMLHAVAVDSLFCLLKFQRRY
jgi:hypothetical protein